MDTHGAVKLKAEAFGWLAVAIAPHDRPFAFSLIDRAMAIYGDPKNEQDFRSWSSYGGRAAFAARMVGQAQEIGYPDMELLVDRVLAMRPTDADAWSPRDIREGSIRAAKMLALVDPGCAKQVLLSVAPQDETVEGAREVRDNLDLLQAWALADIEYAVRVIERSAGASKGETPWTNYLIHTIELLTAPAEERPALMLRHQGGFWSPGEDL
jgi:hypothetical protein